MSEKEIIPPWVMYPGYHPGDTFWRQSGEIWFTSQWKPYWDSLSTGQQESYLLKWNVPFEWKAFYFDEDFQKWLESTDE